MSIQTFLSDNSLINSSISIINLETLNLSCGYLDRYTIEAFVQPLEIIDVRATRLPILYRPEPQPTVNYDDLLLDAVGDIEAAGLAHLIATPADTVTVAQYSVMNSSDTAGDVLPTDLTSVSGSRSMTITLDSTKLSSADSTALSTMTSDQQGFLFNIVEYLELGTISTDSLYDINATLLNGTSFAGYVADSLHVSALRDQIYIFGGLNIHRLSPKSFEFQFQLGAHTLDIKLWFDNLAFDAEYGYSTIINIVPPMTLSVLLDPSGLVDPINSAVLGKAWSDAVLEPELDTNEQTGMYLFRTRYIYGANTYQVTFTLMYRGMSPDALTARQFIANYLLSSGVGTKTLWSQLLPDIFFDSEFALIPMYDNKTVLTNADVYPSIIDSSDIDNRVNQIAALFPQVTSTTREIITAAFDKYFIGVAPANANVAPSILSLHPTYQSFSTTEDGFINMSADDRQWAITLNQALSVAAGGTNILTVNKVSSGGLDWINFVMNDCSYLILTKTSFDSYFQLA